jgi:uncharacterized membrane protein
MIVVLIVMTGLMAGVYFTFSVVVMKSLAEMPAFHAAKAMNKINDAIINTVFLPIFFGTTLWYAGLIVWWFADWQSGSSMLEILAALTYIVGMFFVTAFGNVPLNNKLKESEDNESTLIIVWSQYLQQWTQLNHLRTVSCIVSCALLVIAQI